MQRREYIKIKTMSEIQPQHFFLRFLQENQDFFNAPPSKNAKNDSY